MLTACPLQLQRAAADIKLRLFGGHWLSFNCLSVTVLRRLRSNNSRFWLLIHWAPWGRSGPCPFGYCLPAGWLLTASMSLWGRAHRVCGRLRCLRSCKGGGAQGKVAEALGRGVCSNLTLPAWQKTTTNPWVLSMLWVAVLQYALWTVCLSWNNNLGALGVKHDCFPLSYYFNSHWSACKMFIINVCHLDSFSQALFWMGKTKKFKSDLQNY